jgi:hypothetical protein
MHPFANFAYAKLNIDFDPTIFIDEYDNCILPAARAVRSLELIHSNTRRLNQSWGMVDTDLYDQLSVDTACGNSDGIPQFDITQLLELCTIDSDSDYVKIRAGMGGSTMRNHHLNRLYKLKPEFKQLKIVKFILKNLPLQRIVSIHCVSMEPGSFACIHRDLRFEFDDHSSFTKNLGANNGVYQQGHVIIVLNLSDGGVPLWWSLDGVDNKKVYQSNDLVYLSSDYFLHGVPVCTSRRRQIRITGVPKPQLLDLVDHSTKIELPANYKFDSEENWFPG